MAGSLESLTEAEIDRIGRLVEMLDKSAFEFMTIELEQFRLTIGKGAVLHPHARSAAPGEAVKVSQPSPTTQAAQTAASVPVQVAAAAAAAEDAVDVLAPTMGRFYARPEPSALPFVTVGAQVEADATVGLIEVMKLFNGVPAGVDGVVAEICVEDGQFVEYGQVLMRIVPHPD